jgi:hypothetical protein
LVESPGTPHNKKKNVSLLGRQARHEMQQAEFYLQELMRSGNEENLDPFLAQIGEMQCQ